MQARVFLSFLSQVRCILSMQFWYEVLAVIQSASLETSPVFFQAHEKVFILKIDTCFLTVSETSEYMEGWNQKSKE